MEQRLKIDIGVTTILKIIATLVMVYLVFLVREIIALLFITIIIVAALSPLTDYLQKHLKYRGIAVAIVFLSFLIVVAGILYAIIPPLVTQSRQLAADLPSYLDRLAPYYRAVRDYSPSLQNSLDKISSSLAVVSSNIFSATAGIFGGIVSLFTVIVISFYLLLDKKAFRDSFFSILPVEKREDVAEITRKLAIKVGDWLRSQILLGIIIAIIDLIGLLIVGVPYALTIAIVSGLLEIVPVIGPVISGAIAVAVALTVSPLTALIVLIFYIVVQQLENHILIPQIMKKALGLSPVVVIVAIVTGAKLLGVVGALLSIPIAAVILVIAQDWSVVKRIFSNGH